MAGTLKVIRRVLVESGAADVYDHGDVQAAILNTAVAAVDMAKPRSITLAPGDSKTIWKWVDDGDFVLLFIECSGYAWIAQHVDLPTDAAATPPDYTPVGGTSSNWFKDSIACFEPKYFGGMAVPTVPSVANAAASAFHATTANGRRYELVVKNPADAEDDITVTFGWVL